MRLRRPSPSRAAEGGGAGFQRRVSCEAGEGAHPFCHQLPREVLEGHDCPRPAGLFFGLRGGPVLDLEACTVAATVAPGRRGWPARDTGCSCASSGKADGCVHRLCRSSPSIGWCVACSLHVGWRALRAEALICADALTVALGPRILKCCTQYNGPLEFSSLAFFVYLLRA